MVRDTTCRSVLITVSLLLVGAALSHAQGGRHRQQEPRDVTVAPTPSTASAPERRVALVIGNSAYQYTAPLKNPANDAQDIARVLKELQFQVLLRTDATLDIMACHL